jgi:ribose/xylose/arabinose/galactoside ABC-type transport system permease subunit
MVSTKTDNVQQVRIKSRILKFILFMGVWLWLIVFAIFFAALSPEYFFTIENLLNIVKQAALYGIISIGMTFVIISGGIDLSVGSLISLTGAVVGIIWQTTNNIILAIVCGMLVGLVAGTISGALIAYGRLPPFIATFGMLSIGRGMAFVITPYSIGGFPQWFELLGNGRILGIRVVVIIFIALIIIFHLILSKTKFGSDIFSIGGNENSARLAGINVSLRKTTVYMITGSLASFVSIILCSQLRSEYPGIGQNYELNVIAATIIGGTDLMGGFGSIINTGTGSILVGIINNGLTMKGVYPFMQQIITGGLIIVAVLANIFLYRRGEILQKIESYAIENYK